MFTIMNTVYLRKIKMIQEPFAMIILVWNIRGPNDSIKKRELGQCYREERSLVYACLVEG